jgi:branched-chain amino acid transport system substrate-binding protein
MSNRRNFLKIAGVGLTGALVKPVSAQSAKLSASNIKIGVLLPQSVEHPLYPGSFYNGLRCGLDQRKALKLGKIEVITEAVNFGTPQITKEKIQKLVTENNVHAIVGILNSEVAAYIGELVNNAQIPTLIANAGESYITTELKSNPFLFFNSLNLFQAAFHAGKYAVEKFGKRISVVTSFYDSGYDSLYTFRQGVESSGGEIIETLLEKQGEVNFENTSVNQLKSSRPDAVYVFLNGNKADNFIRNYYFSAINIPILSTAFVVEKHRAVNLGEAVNNVVTIGSWDVENTSKQNKEFVSKYQKATHKMPDNFSMLGYESGQLLYASLAKSGSDLSANTISNQLKNLSIASPRGEINVNPKSGFVNNQLLVRKTKVLASGEINNDVIEKITPVNEYEELFASLDNTYRSGWLNPYLFV